jgi:hypothetical protein
VEFDGSVKPFTNAAIDFNGDYQHATYTAPAYSGYDNNTVVRAPTFKFFLTGTYVGMRYSDLQNLQVLPSYETLDIGLATIFNERYEVLFTGTNVTNSLGVTEGNPRATGTTGVVGDIGQYRAIYGAQYLVTARMHF